MAEYYTVLKRAIAGIDPNIPDARRAVYDKARNALIGQLKAVDPPLTTAEISRQRLELEEAIRRVERESAAGLAPRPEPASPPPAEPAGRPPPQASITPPSAHAAPTPAYQDGQRPSPQDVFRRAIQEAGMRGGSAAAPVERARVSARAEAARHSTTAPDLRRSPDETPVAREPVRRAPPPPPPSSPEPDYYPPQAAEVYEPEPRLAPEYDQEWERAPSPSRAPPPSLDPQLDSRDRLAFAQKARGRNRGYLESEADDEDLVERPARRSRLPGIILFVLIIGIVGGLGALGWSQRAVLMDLLASFESSEPPSLGEAPPDPEEPAVAASSKNTDRLLAGEEPAPMPAPDREVRMVSDDPDAPAEMAAASGGESMPAPAATATALPAGAQKAILYEEPVGGAANGGLTAINADVSWRFIEEGPNGPEVEARLEVPERDMSIRLALHKNGDDTLPASHLIEVTVDTPANFPGEDISEVPRVVLKPSEDAAGQSLVGAAAKVADGFFWIALSANQNDIASNLALLRARNWIDLPFRYGNGQRAILTFEKGAAGQQVFDEALAAWGS